MNVEFVAPQKIYQQPRQSASDRLVNAGWTMSQPVGLAKTRTGGVATIFPGHPFPRKTFIYAGITQPNNKAKRVTLALFLPFASLKRGIKVFFNEYLSNYNRLIDSIYNDLDQIPYLKYEYYSEFGKGLWDFTYFFLKKIGIKDEIAYKTGLQISTMIEYDDAYMVRLQDIFNEAIKENLLKNPRKEILRLLDIYKQREKAFVAEDDMRHAGARIIGMAKILTFLLYIPSINNAFKFAVKTVNFDFFKMDEWDRYWALARGDYECFGRPFKDRHKEMINISFEYMKKVNPGKDIRIQEENGQVLIKAY